MSLEPDFVSCASTTVVIEPLSTHNSYAAPEYGAGVTYVAHVEELQRLVRKDDGQEVMAKFQVFVMSSSASISTHDRIAAAGSTELGIFESLTLNDTDGQHHVELLLG